MEQVTRVIGKNTRRELYILDDLPEQKDVYYSVDTLIVGDEEIKGDAAYLLNLFSFITSK